ncbi:MAG: UDP-N-acetylglucosamine 2-epimerase (non-hydrolyzing) [Armatimonadetes bacterium]|nr:UDP-N-acetylglucosamine 2-epimerase (non-hydrolyzing) [Armatimonadota bacterium]
MAKPQIVCVVGTRPDAIKSAPVILELQRFADRCDTVVVATGQHREMLQQVLDSFSIECNTNLDVMTQGQSLAQITTRTLEGLDKILSETTANMVVAQGDTTTTFTAGLASFYRHVPFAHVEAGLRTDTIWNPFPEEFNRRAVGLFAALHFAPTLLSAQNLILSGVPDDTIFVTGNTAIDAVVDMAERSDHEWYPKDPLRIVVLTTHRRENWGHPQQEIARACRRLVEAVPNIRLVCPMHRNPAVRETLSSELSHHDRIDLIEPPEYESFIKLIQRADLILTDSGGVQEEAPSFGKPILVLRETTERPEGVHSGVAKLVGHNADLIFEEAHGLLTDPIRYQAMARSHSPYGDGRAAQRIRYLILRHLGVESPAEAMWEH